MADWLSRLLFLRKQGLKIDGGEELLVAFDSALPKLRPSNIAQTKPTLHGNKI